ncbi:MAG: porin [Sideroxydans sp.]|nr:porin [Sideroxydans sp.]
MKKTIVALAVAAAFSSTAFADNANVTVYGKVDVDFESVKTSNPNGTSNNVVPTTITAASALPGSMTRVATNASRFGVKGSEDLGEGLSAFYQFEVQMDANGNSGNGFGNGTRNSGVGIKSADFGSVTFGVWDTPFKLSHNKIELFDNTHFASSTNLIGRSGATTAVTGGTPLPVAGTTGTAASQNFNTRLKNVVQYASPVIEGFEGKLAYGTDVMISTNVNGAVAATGPVGLNAAGTNVAIDKSSLSYSLTYDQELFYVALASEAVFDAANKGTAKGDNKASRAVGALKFGDAGFVGVTVEKMSITDSAAAANTVESHSRTGFELAASYKLNAHRFGGAFVKMGDLGSYKDTGASQLSLRYGFNFSKRTEAYVMYSQLTNAKYGQYNFSAGNVVTGAAGAKLTGFGAGVSHSF